MGRLSVLLLGAVLVEVAFSQAVNLRSLCNSQLTCADCITANPGCVWCAAKNFNLTRCYGNDDMQSNCPEQVQNPMRETPVPTPVNLENLVQISPSSVYLRVRPLVPSTFTLTVRPASNFPIDLYLLMDLSFSMEDELQNLKSLGQSLAERIRSLSANFRIGFGSFVEKVLGPYTSLDPAIQNNPCPGHNPPCVPTYAYRHVISLTSNASEFDGLVQAQQISGNQDSSEGGFDGLLQSVLCTNLIGWRSTSRKLLLFITDAGFHFAGDGKLGGVILPHKSVCSLPNSIPSGATGVLYNGAETFDYPSIGQIARALRDQDIIPIFAATCNVRNIYESLAAEIGEGAFVGTLDRDSNNVVTLVETLYNTISQRVIFEQEEVPGVAVTVKAKTCPNGFVTVRALGFGTFDVVEPNSASCSGNGTFSCGQCSCNPGFFGGSCQCDASNQATQVNCPLSANNLQCNGRGACVCGVCNCQDGFFGSTCECDERDCVNQNLGLVCSGRGTCGCTGQCNCNEEPVTSQPYFGDLNVCECTPNQQNCRDPTNRTSICNGRGTCGCEGNCMCQNPYFGTFCELCSGSQICFDSNCESNRDCANCILDLVVPTLDTLSVEKFFLNDTIVTNLPDGSALSMDDINKANQITLPALACPVCSSGAVIINGTDKTEYQIGGESAVHCEEVKQTCIHRYYAAISDNNDFTAVHVEYTRVCPAPWIGATPWVIVIGIIIPLLVLGILALILFKVLLFIYDYVEVKKFEKELGKTKYSKNENPLYRNAAKDYKNPIYGQ